MEQHVCSITLEPIKEAGITCVGSVYEYSVIQEWLTTHTTDPLTNLNLYTPFVIRFSIDDLEALEEKVRDVRLTTQLLDNTFGLKRRSELEFETLSKLLPNVNGKDWDIYQIVVMEHLRNKDYSSVIRPSNTGSCFQLLTFSGSFCGHNWKGRKFDFALFKNCMFVECNFSRATFAGVKFDQVIFRNCKFIGEEISFFQADVKKLIFLDCEMEYASVWKTTRDPKEIKRILKDRLLEGVVSVI